MIKKTNINYNDCYLLIICFTIGLAIIGTNSASLVRYVKYLLPALLLSFLVLGKKSMRVYRVLGYNFYVLAFLILVNTLNAIIIDNITFRYIEEVTLIILPIFAAVFATGLKDLGIRRIIDSLFAVYSLIYFLSNAGNFFDLHLINNFISAFKSSNLDTESWIAFPLGLFTSFYILEKRWRLSLISFFLFLMAFKRIAIAGLFLGILIYWFFYVKRQNRFVPIKTLSLFILLNISLLYILYNFIQGNYNEIIFNITGLSTNHFTQGRFQIYTDTVREFNGNLFLGNSLGSTNIYLKNRFENIDYLHSDILKILLEMGVFSYLFWLVSFFKINLVNKKAIPILIFMNILFLTDNVFIYFDTLFLFYLIIVYYQGNE